MAEKIANRRTWFLYIFDKCNVTMDDVSKAMGIEKDTVYRKLRGINAFSEKDIKKLLELLNMKFEEVFVD